MLNLQRVSRGLPFLERQRNFTRKSWSSDIKPSTGSEKLIGKLFGLKRFSGTEATPDPVKRLWAISSSTNSAAQFPFDYLKPRSIFTMSFLVPYRNRKSLLLSFIIFQISLYFAFFCILVIFGRHHLSAFWSQLNTNDPNHVFIQFSKKWPFLCIPSRNIFWSSNKILRMLLSPRFLACDSFPLSISWMPSFGHATMVVHPKPLWRRYFASYSNSI